MKVRAVCLYQLRNPLLLYTVKFLYPLCTVFVTELHLR
jgi:hypothetical protein